MNTANKLTMARVVMIPLFLIVLYIGFTGSNYVALGIFVLASLTDFVDGQVARRCNQVTDFGKFMDPLADKVLVLAAMLWFTQEGIMPAWAVIIVVARELAVTGMRLLAATDGRVIAAGKSGKVKTACTMVCLIIMFLPVDSVVNWVCTGVIVATTVYSGGEYLIKNRALFSQTK
jgi:CDP-diacylglycerol--glycerol-3-phosphate 3-phosphatidyltransferase